MLKAVSISVQNLRRPCVSVFSQLRVLGSYLVVSNYPMYTTQGNFIIYVVVYPIKLSKQKIIWIFNIIFSSFCLDLLFFFLMIEMFDCY